jgi:hypothetical protein
MSYAGWIEYDKKTNAEATATRTGESSKQHIIYAITATLGETTLPTTKTVSLKDDTTTIWEGTVSDGQTSSTFIFPKGIAITAAAAASAVIEASGEAGVDVTVGLHGETV